MLVLLQKMNSYICYKLLLYINQRIDNYTQSKNKKKHQSCVRFLKLFKHISQAFQQATLYEHDTGYNIKVRMNIETKWCKFTIWMTLNVYCTWKTFKQQEYLQSIVMLCCHKAKLFVFVILISVSTEESFCQSKHVVNMFKYFFITYKYVFGNEFLNKELLSTFFLHVKIALFLPTAYKPKNNQNFYTSIKLVVILCCE